MRVVRNWRRTVMLHRGATYAFTMAAALVLTIRDAPAADGAKYPNWKGQWNAIVTPETAYILLSSSEDPVRRIFTDGRAWPSEIEPTYHGYSIGRWIDEDGDGAYDVLEV